MMSWLIEKVFFFPITNFCEIGQNLTSEYPSRDGNDDLSSSYCVPEKGSVFSLRLQIFFGTSEATMAGV